MRVVLLFGPLAPRLAALAAAHLSSIHSPLALSLRLLASGPVSRAWSSREPSDLSGHDQGDPLGLL